MTIHPRSYTKEHEEADIGLISRDEVYAIIGAAIEVKKNLGHGFLEAIYQEAFELEMRELNIPFEAQKEIEVSYKGHILSKKYYADIVCFENILIELKAINKLMSNDEAQLLNYLKASNYAVGLLINFGSPGKLEWKRFVL